jgi:preprotein translocase subunit SecE
VAERNRRGTGAADEYGDDPFDEGGSRDLDTPRGGGAAVKSRPSGGFGRIGRFIREVVAELRKVIWPTRKELLTYAVVVIIFIAILMSIIALYDLVFGRIVQFVFGG